MMVGVSDLFLPYKLLIGQRLALDHAEERVSAQIGVVAVDEAKCNLVQIGPDRYARSG
jgi:hypothetical protein